MLLTPAILNLRTLHFLHAPALMFHWRFNRLDQGLANFCKLPDKKMFLALLAAAQLCCCQVKAATDKYIGR